MTWSQKLEQGETRETENDSTTSHEEPPCLNEPGYYKGTWMEPIVEYLTNGKLPPNQTEARKVKCHAILFTIFNGILYKKGYALSYLRCVNHEDGFKLLTKAQSGFCGDHSNGIKLAKKIIRHGFYWPQLTNQAIVYVKRCKGCQRYAKITRLPPSHLTPITSLWPFDLWEIDLIRPMPISKGGAKYAVVAIDYFTKWVEAEPLPKITSGKVLQFVIKK